MLLAVFEFSRVFCICKIMHTINVIIQEQMAINIAFIFTGNHTFLFTGKYLPMIVLWPIISEFMI